VELDHDSRRSYVVLELEAGSVVVTEMLASGAISWQENPDNLEGRNALAKVIRSSDCSRHGIAIRAIKENKAAHSATSKLLECKYYAQAVYNTAINAGGTEYTGFRKPEQSRKWQLSERKYGLYATTSAGAEAAGKEQRASKAESKSGQRLNIGDKVKIKISGRQGTITSDDQSSMPYQVVFLDGQRPKTKWCKEADLVIVK